MKKMLALALVLTCLLSLSVSAFAATQRAATEEMAPCTADQGYAREEEASLGIVTPMDTPCPHCGEYAVSSTKTYCPWTTTGNVRVCYIHDDYTDKEQVRGVMVTTVCENCECGSTDLYEEYRWYCTRRHYAHPIDQAIVSWPSLPRQDPV